MNVRDCMRFGQYTISHLVTIKKSQTTRTVFSVELGNEEAVIPTVLHWNSLSLMGWRLGPLSQYCILRTQLILRNSASSLYSYQLDSSVEPGS